MYIDNATVNDASELVDIYAPYVKTIEDLDGKKTYGLSSFVDV